MCESPGVAIPTYDQVIEPLLRLLGERRDPTPTREVYNTLAERLALSEEERTQLLPSRQQPVYQNPIRGMVIRCT